MAATIIRSGIWMGVEGTLSEVLGELKNHAIDPNKVILTYNSTSNTFVAIFRPQK